jgi:hypothetical protein
VSAVPFQHTEIVGDWSSGGAEGVQVERDADVRHFLSASVLRASKNLRDARVGQTAIITPRKYRFEAYIKTLDITTDQGIRLRLSDPAEPFTWRCQPNHYWEPMIGRR